MVVKEVISWQCLDNGLRVDIRPLRDPCVWCLEVKGLNDVPVILE